MHISEGVLSGPVLLAGAGLAAAGVSLGLKKMDYDRMPRVAMLSAVFFLASLVHVPVGPTSVHLVLNGLVGLVLGWAAFPAILVALSLQAVLFQFGGLTGLGVNVLDMALPAVAGWYIFGPWVRGHGNGLAWAASFLAGFSALFMSSLMLALALIFTGESFMAAAGTIVAAHLPVMVIEGLLTAACVHFLRKVKPEVLHVAVTA
ncbi:MAG: cobalt transporter CbiM [Thermodesulfobacteriota bacterium]